MITPRRTRLVRVPDLRAFRHAIVGLSVAGDRERLLSRIVLVPNDGAARQLRRTIGTEPVPTLATREEFYDVLHARLDSPPRRLTAYDRDVIVQAAARDASISLNFIPGVSTVGLRSSSTQSVPNGSRDGGSRLRPGLVAEILRFYDQLRRQTQAPLRGMSGPGKRLEPQGHPPFHRRHPV